MVLLDTTVLAVAEPDLARSLHGTVAGLQWAVTGYTVVFGALLLSAGAVADRYRAHRVFRAGIAAFAVASCSAPPRRTCGRSSRCARCWAPPPRPACPRPWP